MESRRRNSTPSTGPWMTSAIGGHHMDVAEAGSWIGGRTRNSGSGEVINHIAEGYDFTKAFMSPLYPYLRDAQIVNEQLRSFYYDESPSNREVRRLLGDLNDIKRRDIFINCFIRHLWQLLGVWNDNWGIPGLPGYQDNIANWRWRWREGEDQLDLLAADRDRRHRAHVRKAGRRVFTFTPSYKQICLRRTATVAEAEEFISSRPWFVHGAQVVAKGKCVKNAWRVQRRWVPEWDHYNPGWRWDGDNMAIANPKFLLNLLSDNEKKALGLQDSPARSLRHWGRCSLPAALSSRSSDTRYNDTPRGQTSDRRTSQTSSQGSPDVGQLHQRFGEAYFARSYSHLASSSAADPAQTLVDDNEEEIWEAISPVAPRIQVSIANFKLGLCPDQFTL
ncbi:unnamed protein product [Clonostachys rosea f. rosea IK726]|uniref:Uncharacterized protein n=1 Tax=Clonostachys rosea f. rosea IK726 TaxID=1349383 RepID=A0ACA9U8W2_BIOOC|nr:unnamed protein product [Clonostachys rosea f. rosea IK726]